MNRINSIKFGSDYTVVELGVMDESQFPPVPAVGGGGIARLFNNSKGSAVSSAVSSGTTVSVERIRSFEVGDEIYVSLSTGVWHPGGALVSKSGSDLVITNAIPSAVRVGMRVAVKVGPDVPMVAFGTPAARTFDWGYGGNIADDHAGLVIGMRVLLETTIDVQAGQRLVNNYETIVVGGT